MKHILVVDDSKTNLAIAKQELSEDYQVTPVISGFQALQFLEKRSTDLILLDINMPEMDGKETLKKVKENPLWENIPIIFLTADSTPETESECLALGADDFIAKPFVPKVMKRRIGRIIELNELRHNLEARLEEMTKQVERVTIQSITAIAKTIDEKDKYTSGHSTRVAQCAEALAERLGWSEDEIQNLHYVALLHDIGKIGVPDIILNKPSRLTDSEFEIIKKHTIMGNEILKGIKTIDNINEGALYHHERYDGRGYPCGIKGEEIPVMARVVCIADAYDAMTSSRIYRPKLMPEDVINEFVKGKGTQFDPEFCQVFIDMLKEGFSVAGENDPSPYEVSEENKALSEGLMAQVAMDNTEGNRDCDYLTGLYNRKYIEDKVDQMFQSGYDGALFAIDLDDFKQVNDRYGHVKGDNLLKVVAEVLRKKATQNDILCRMAADQFIVFFRGLKVADTAKECAQSIIEALNEAFAQENCGNVSASVGIAIGKGEQVTFAQLYSKADKALYHVKSAGKNSYHLFQGEKEQRNKSTEADIDSIRSMLAQDEALKNKQQIQTILLTVEEGEADALALEKAMEALEKAILDALPRTETMLKYSTSQYLAVLADTDKDTCQTIAESMIKKFYCVNSEKGISLSYDILEI